MPASSINFYHMQDAKNNFDAIRPAPICSDANYFMGQCRNLHISTNCYYGYHNSSNRSETIQDTEMGEITTNVGTPLKIPPVMDNNSRKRCAEENEHSRSKRLRQGLLSFVAFSCSSLLLAISQQFQDVKSFPASILYLSLINRGYGATDFQLQPMFTASNPQQSRYFSLSHGPYVIACKNKEMLYNF